MLMVWSTGWDCWWEHSK